MAHHDTTSKCHELGSAAEWLSKSALYAPDVLLDQELILDGYRVRFALDFSVLREYLRPWAQDDVHDDTSALENIYATAYLTHELERKTHLGRTLLLPEYLEEYLEHAAYTALTGLYGDWHSMQQAIVKLEHTYPRISELYRLDAAERDVWLRNNVEVWTSILSRDFATLAKLAFSGEWRYPRAANRPTTLDLGAVFDDPVGYAEHWRDIGSSDLYSSLFRPMYAHVQRTVKYRTQSMPTFQRQRQIEQAERSCRRDACALQRVIQLNEVMRRDGCKEVVYLLTSSRRFWHALENDKDGQFREACRLTLSKGNDSASTVAVRHPFCMVLFLAYWPSSSDTADMASRRRLVSTLTSLHSRASAYSGLISQARESSRRLGGGDTGVSDKINDDMQNALGSWQNLALSLRHTELLPASFSAEGMARSALRFLSIMREASYGDFRALLLQQCNAAYNNLMKALYELIECHANEVVTREFIKTRMGQVCAFPYMIDFESTDVQQQVERIRAVRKQWLSGGQAGINLSLEATRSALQVLLRLLAPEERPSEEAPLLVVALLILLNQGDEAVQFMRAAGYPEGERIAREWRYLRAFVAARQVVVSEHASAKDCELAAERISDGDRRADPRIQDRWLLLRALQLQRQEDGPPAEDVQAVLDGMAELATDLERKGSRWFGRGREIEKSLAWRVWNNYVYFKGVFGSMLSRPAYQTEAYLAAKEHLACIRDWLPTEVTHTIGRAAFLWAMTCDSPVEKRRGLLEARVWYRRVSAEMGIAETVVTYREKELHEEMAIIESELLCEE